MRSLLKNTFIFLSFTLSWLIINLSPLSSSIWRIYSDSWLVMWIFPDSLLSLITVVRTTFFKSAFFLKWVVIAFERLKFAMVSAKRIKKSLEIIFLNWTSLITSPKLNITRKILFKILGFDIIQEHFNIGSGCNMPIFVILFNFSFRMRVEKEDLLDSIVSKPIDTIVNDWSLP